MVAKRYKQDPFLFCCHVLLFYDVSFLLNINVGSVQSYIFFMLYETRAFLPGWRARSLSKEFLFLSFYAIAKKINRIRYCAEHFRNFQWFWRVIVITLIFGIRVESNPKNNTLKLETCSSTCGPHMGVWNLEKLFFYFFSLIITDTKTLISIMN